MTDQRAARPAMIERLEPRAMFVADPTVVGAAAVDAVPGPPRVVSVLVLGENPRRAAGVRVTFSEPLDPASAERPDCYVVAGTLISYAELEADRPVPPDPFNDVGPSTTPPPDLLTSRRRRVTIDAADYDPATLTVTLRAAEPFDVGRFMQVVRVSPRVRDAAGNMLDGNADGVGGDESVHRFRITRGKKVNFRDADGDVVRLRLTAAGKARLYVLQERPSADVRTGRAVQAWVYNDPKPTAALQGTISPGRHGAGDGAATIGELRRATGVRLDLLDVPGFAIGEIVP
ncbi:MAG TPA: hypothetical protein VF796_21110 [Humisphaera sp.]